MANRNIFESLTQYRLKVEKDGKSIADIPTVFALPGLLMAPKLSIAGLVAAPLLGFKVHLENGDGKEVDVENAVRKAADAVKETVTTAAKTIKEEADKAWEAVSAEDPKEDEEDEAEPNAEEPAEQEENGAPVIEVKPEDSMKE